MLYNLNITHSTCFATRRYLTGNIFYSFNFLFFFYFHETKSSATAEIARVGGRYAVQGHSRSPIFVPIESPYVTSYYWRILTPSYILQRFQVIVDWPNVCFVFNVLVRVDPKLAAMKFGVKKRDISLYHVVWNLFRYVWITSVTDGRTDGQTE